GRRVGGQPGALARARAQSPRDERRGDRVRVCLIYDCLFPWTIGGAERWMRALGERLAAEGHDVTYLTLRQWERDEPPAVPGVEAEVLTGVYTGPLEPFPPEPAEPLVVFAGRLIPEKRAPAVAPAVVAASRKVDGLHGIVFGDGPERAAVDAAAAASGGL